MNKKFKKGSATLGVVAALALALASGNNLYNNQAQNINDTSENVSSGYEVSDYDAAETTLTFKNDSLKNQHYEKHGKEMGYKNADEYEQAAAAVVNNPASLHKLEAEDGDDVYYLEATNEFVIVSSKGYIRTYYYPGDGKAYFDRQ